MTKPIVLGLVVFAAGALLVGNLHEESPVHVAIVADCSGSTVGGCNSVVGLAGRALAVEGIDTGSMLWLLATGTEASAFQPPLLGGHSLHLPRKAIEGTAGDARRRSEFLAKVAQDCDKMHKAKSSPVFMAAKQAISQLRSAGCKVDQPNPCALFVETDLEETVVKSIAQALARPAHSGLAELPTPLDNRNLRVVFCGTAETVKGRARKVGPDHLDRLQEVWKALFQSPELVSFEPYCPKSDDMAPRLGESQRAVAR